MHPFLYPEYVDAVHGERIRYRRSGTWFRPDEPTPARRRTSDF